MNNGITHEGSRFLYTSGKKSYPVGSIDWTNRQMVSMIGFNYGDNVLEYLLRQAKKEGVNANIHDAEKWHNDYLETVVEYDEHK